MRRAGRLLALLILLAIVAVAWFGGPELRDRFAPEPAPPAASASSAELASSAIESYEAVVRGEAERAVLTGAEVESVLLLEGRPHLPDGLEELRVRFTGGEAHVDVSVPFDLLPDLLELERVRQALPGTISLTLRGFLLSVDGAEAVFLVHRIDAVGVPLPRGLFSAALGSLAPAGRPELPREAFPVPLPVGIGSVYIDEDRLVLIGSS